MSREFWRAKAAGVPCFCLLKVARIMKKIAPPPYLSAPTPLLSARDTLTFSYAPSIAVDTWQDLTGTPAARMYLVNPSVRSAIYVILLWSMRSAEYLSATIGDLLGNDFLLIRGCKGSASYRINLPGIDAQVSKLGSVSPGRLVAGVSYKQLYAGCVRCSIGFQVPSRKNLARLHSGRYNLAKEVSLYGQTTVSDVLHHRAKSSASHYSGVKEVSYG